MPVPQGKGRPWNSGQTERSRRRGREVPQLLRVSHDVHGADAVVLCDLEGDGLNETAGALDDQAGKPVHQGEACRGVAQSLSGDADQEAGGAIVSDDHVQRSPDCAALTNADTSRACFAVVASEASGGDSPRGRAVRT